MSGPLEDPDDDGDDEDEPGRWTVGAYAGMSALCR